MTEKKVLVYGSLNLDHVYSVDHFAGPGETEGGKINEQRNRKTVSFD